MVQVNFNRDETSDLVWNKNTHEFVIPSGPEHLYALSTSQDPPSPEIPTTLYTDSPTITSESTLYDDEGNELQLYNEEGGFYWTIVITPNSDPSKCTITYVNPGA